MKYFIVTYVKKRIRDGRGFKEQMDEVVGVAKRLKNRDISTANVILDFEKKQVIKASFGEISGSRDWSHIRDFYYQHYKDIIDDLEGV
jgi:hypothetical protein